MRKQADGLLATVHAVLGRPAAAGELYLFWNRNKDLIKVVYLDRTGVCVFAKRVHRGRFELTFEGRDGAATVTLDGATLSSIVTAAQCHGPSGSDREKQPATRAKKRATRPH
jgi:transposase